MQCTRRETSLIFTLQSVCYSLGNLLGGLLNQHIRLRKMLLVSAAAISSGLILTSLGGSLSQIFISYGIIWGLGSGIMNNTVLSNGFRWFPDRPGFATGTMLSFFGVGSFLLGLLVSFTLASAGWRGLFLAIGLFFGCLSLLLSFFITPPPIMPSDSPKVPGGLPAKEMLRTRSFWQLFCWAALLMTGGMLALSNAAPIAISMGADVSLAGLIASLLALANAFGRVGGGFLYDRLGSLKMIKLTDFIFLCSCFTMAAALFQNSLGLLVITFFCMGITYGLTLMCSTTLVKERYGARYYSTNLSVILITAIPSSLIGPGATGFIKTRTGSYRGILFIMVFLLLLLLPLHHIQLKAKSRTKTDQIPDPFDAKK